MFSLLSVLSLFYRQNYKKNWKCENNTDYKSSCYCLCYYRTIQHQTTTELKRCCQDDGEMSSHFLRRRVLGCADSDKQSRCFPSWVGLKLEEWEKRAVLSENRITFRPWGLDSKLKIVPKVISSFFFSPPRALIFNQFASAFYSQT